MTIRYPLPWEEDQDPRRVPDSDPTVDRPPGQGASVAFPGAEELASRVAADPDPHLSRRGAGGAAGALHAESESRSWDLDATACRDRVNRARSTAANKHRRTT